MTRFLQYAAFVVGLAAVCWVGVGYVGTNPLALAITLIVGAFYLMGALELHHFNQATTTLSQAVASESAEPPANLGQWLGQLHPSLQNAVRLRVEGVRVALPGPAMTPYLAGLLVLLGMLGTFLGMVVTLNGTGLALESAADVQAIRSSLAAPVRGLGIAFGTSVAGVAASAMLGLVSALCRRDRLQAAQLLDTRIATTLRVFSLAHQREESFRLLQRQGEAMPVLVDRLQALMSTMERQNHALNERLVASQESFHHKAEAAYAGLASTVGQSLKESLTESARAASATIQPVVEATMASIAREAAVLNGTVESSVQRQLDGLTTRLEATTADVGEIWQSALAGHQQTNEAQARDLRATLDQFAETFEQRSAALVAGVGGQLEGAVSKVSDTWGSALAQHQRVSDQLSGDTTQALVAAAATFEQHSASLLRTVDQAHADLQSKLASRDEQRLSAWTQALESMATSLHEEWQQAGERSELQQREICETLEKTAGNISAQTQAHARDTIAEIAQLVQTASEAPRAAAEVIGELRQKLADSMARDNTMLEERGRILETLETLLGAVNHASNQQRTAIDALVSASADLLDRVGSRFNDKVDAETGKMAEVAAQITGSAVEVASLGEAFGLAVQLFGQSNDKLVTHLQRIEGALGKAIARSDEQLDYYVAQAREVIDLSIMSQKQIVEDLQHIAAQRTLVGSEA
ncbi:DUF802 domain-containing protein [Variovorax sp. J22R133]|uniref:DUF802 domain-containing protein n=1 Tax=Variovorax brevis TaxID=3053503 RepID=UPI0025768D72|nr:DUF802 domain-containing protein [Variovorax sp. J22R133]MDM0114132.1 DUF802 domain-containing protein [Variovorax sp. J22R133]